ncbi:MAG TPA: 6-phosphogluconolactonase [Methylomirabilota bacterium]|nr:6-phosphogluconolactonase [Methylomirabilota bacterium]
MKNIRVLADPEAVSRAAAEDFTALARAAIGARGRFCVALSGGSTPRRLYGLLAGPPWRDEVDWSRVEFFWGDERTVPPDHPDSNYGVARAALLGPVGVSADRIHRIKGELTDPEQAAREYEAELARVFGATPGGPPPAFDLILLGMGADGHTASLFPRSRALTEPRRWVVSVSVARPGTPRITLTALALNRGREIRLLVTGAEKAATLQEALEGPRDPDRLPVQVVAPEAGRVVWLVDRAAAAKLSGP